MQVQLIPYIPEVHGSKIRKKQTSRDFWFETLAADVWGGVFFWRGGVGGGGGFFYCNEIPKIISPNMEGFSFLGWSSFFEGGLYI